MKVPIYVSGDSKIYLNPVENTVPFPPTIIVNNKSYNFHIHYLCSTEAQIKKLQEHLKTLNIEHSSHKI